MKNSKSWLDVEKKGLGLLNVGREKSFIMFELVSNAFDADGATSVKVILEPIERSASALLYVEDDSPVGFTDLSHAWTLFAESNRKGDPTKRGRFNLGEKNVLSLCREASIETTTGTVIFDDEGRHVYPRRKRAKGSVFEATIRITREEIEEALDALKAVIPPAHITDYSVNGMGIRRYCQGTFKTTLATQNADDEGVLRPSRRQTVVEIHEPLRGETAMIYELGIPVVATGDKYHVNVLQKVPLNKDRDNVTPAFLQELRTAVLNQTFTELAESEVTSAWVRNALEDDSVAPQAVEAVLTKQFGEKRVVADPSDPEGTKIAVSKGYTVIPGNTFSKGAWSNIRSSGAALPAGQVTPSPKPFAPGGRPLKMIDPAAYNSTQKAFVEFAFWFAQNLLNVHVTVKLAADIGWGTVACYGNRELIVNVAKMGLAEVEPVMDLLIHEYAHEYVSDHLSESYYEACTRLGAKAAMVAARNPQPFLNYHPTE